YSAEYFVQTAPGAVVDVEKLTNAMMLPWPAHPWPAHAPAPQPYAPRPAHPAAAYPAPAYPAYNPYRS
ncbi:hypothetical protein, partial [Streptomyces sp. NPDC003487]